MDKNYLKSKMYSLKEEATKEIVDFVFEEVKGKFGFSLDLNTYQLVKEATKIIKKYDRNFQKHTSNGKDDVIKNRRFAIKLRDDTYMFVFTGKYSVFNDKFGQTTGDLNSDDMSLYIFGKKSYKYYMEFERAFENITGTLNKYNISGCIDGNGEQNFTSIVSDLNTRSMDTLFYEDHVKRSIIEHIDNFINSKEMYVSKSLLYKSGVLLYGDPGTGKTSLSTAIATKYQLQMIIIDMNTFDKLDIGKLTACLNSTPNKSFLILLEDIDTLFSNLDRNSNELDKDDKYVVNKLLQLLDSNSSPTNCIFVATTNHIDKLDPAILRDGRFDLKVEVKGISRPVAIDMCKSFELSDSEITDMLANETFPINQSHLQGKLISHIKEKNRTVIS